MYNIITVLYIIIIITVVGLTVVSNAVCYSSGPLAVNLFVPLSDSALASASPPWCLVPLLVWAQRENVFPAGDEDRGTCQPVDPVALDRGVLPLVMGGGAWLYDVVCFGLFPGQLSS